MESIIDVTYDLVEDPDFREWRFLSRGFAGWEELNTLGWRLGLVSCVAHNSRRVTGVLRLTSCKNFARKYMKPDSIQQTNPFYKHSMSLASLLFPSLPVVEERPFLGQLVR